jgi:AraC-like DNA-binding protein
MNPATSSPARYLHLLMRLLEQRDIDCTPALGPLGLSRAGLAHPVAKVPTAPAIGVFQQLVADNGGPALGLDVAQLITWGDLGDLGLAMLSCDNLGQALCFAQEFYGVITPSFCMQVERSPSAMTLTWLPIQAMPYDFVLFCFDMALSTVDRMVEGLMGPSGPICDAYLTRARPKHIDSYKQLKRMRCHFAQPGMLSLRVCLPPAMWDHPMPLRNADELVEARARLAQRLQPVTDDGAAQWVEMMLRQTSGEQPTQAFLAKVLGVSTSTLSRRLTAQGTTFREIANRVRHELACQWLTAQAMSVADVGHRLGYADTTSFVRAFKAMAGVTPGQFAKA